MTAKATNHFHGFLAGYAGRTRQPLLGRSRQARKSASLQLREIESFLEHDFAKLTERFALPPHA